MGLEVGYQGESMYMSQMSIETSQDENWYSSSCTERFENRHVDYTFCLPGLFVDF